MGVEVNLSEAEVRALTIANIYAEEGCVKLSFNEELDEEVCKRWYENPSKYFRFLKYDRGKFKLVPLPEGNFDYHTRDKTIYFTSLQIFKGDWLRLILSDPAIKGEKELCVTVGLPLSTAPVTSSESIPSEMVETRANKKDDCGFANWRDVEFPKEMDKKVDRNDLKLVQERIECIEAIVSNIPNTGGEGNNLLFQLAKAKASLAKFNTVDWTMNWPAPLQETLQGIWSGTTKELESAIKITQSADILGRLEQVQDDIQIQMNWLYHHVSYLKDKIKKQTNAAAFKISSNITAIENLLRRLP